MQFATMNYTLNAKGYIIFLIQKDKLKKKTFIANKFITQNLRRPIKVTYSITTQLPINRIKY